MLANSSRSSPRFLVAKLRPIKTILGVWPILVGLLVLAGWEFDSYFLKRLFPSAVPMNPTTAIMFIMLGWVILKGQRKPILICVAVFMFSIMGLKLCDAFLGTHYRVDSYLFTTKLAGEPGFPNQIAPNAALNFFLTALALFAFIPRRSKWVNVAQLLLVATNVIAYFAIVGYLFDIKSFYGVGLFTPMALITAVTFFITACGLMMERSHEGFLRFIFSTGSAGHMAKCLVPASVIVPLWVGWLRLLGQRYGYYDAELGVALSVVLNSLTIFVVTCIGGQFLFRADLKRQLAEQELSILASQDPLTGLNTRRIVLQQLNRRISLAQRRPSDRYAVFYLDIDGLKRVNDQLGHLEGDKLLIQVALLLVNSSRSSDTVARLGGDEFIILLEEVEDGSELVLADRILERMPKLFISDKGEVPVGISIGIVTPPATETNPDNILEAADEALYEAKISGKNKYCISKKYT